ncbi:Cytochrome P450 2S1 [Clarias magur]|uniref:Cytochrome P450 2S1 n=1 Tax=Clarias magur TaxID=1594786 RepID=A0A8J4X8S7_CLAMG|nr:Cytochrome P450 2S1 [Clarias magur]
MEEKVVWTERREILNWEENHLGLRQHTKEKKTNRDKEEMIETHHSRALKVLLGVSRSNVVEICALWFSLRFSFNTKCYSKTEYKE